ncbi:MAG: amino acid permease [Sutterella seckii]
MGGLIALLSGICFAELGAMMPKAGSYYVYLREAYGERVAFMCGITNFFLSSSGSISALALRLLQPPFPACIRSTTWCRRRSPSCRSWCSPSSTCAASSWAPWCKTSSWF